MLSPWADRVLSPGSGLKSGRGSTGSFNKGMGASSSNKGVMGMKNLAFFKETQKNWLFLTSVKARQNSDKGRDSPRLQEVADQFKESEQLGSDSQQ